MTDRPTGKVNCVLLPTVAACSLWFVDQFVQAQEDRLKPPPTHAGVRYGPHDRNVLDFWQAKSERPTPLVIYIHGGGFRNGSKDGLDAQKVIDFLDAGIAVAAINYRLLEHAFLPAAHHDSRRAVQFLRTKADGWNLDTNRFGAFGGSAGAQLCMYLAFHDDMADPRSRDPVERQSTRLKCVAGRAGQTTMDLKWWRDHLPQVEGDTSMPRPATDYFGSVSAADRDRIVQEISATSLISRDDPPFFLSYIMAPDSPQPDEPGRVRSWWVHHVRFGQVLFAKAKELGVFADLHYPGANSKYKSDLEFFRDQLLDPTLE
jgi:hypothetical protein